MRSKRGGMKQLVDEKMLLFLPLLVSLLPGHVYSWQGSPAGVPPMENVTPTNTSGPIHSAKISTTGDIFGPPESNCEMTDMELKLLSDAIQTATDKLHGLSRNSTDEGFKEIPTTGWDGSCMSIITQVGSLANDIVKQTMFLQFYKFMDADKYETLKAEYTQLHERFDRIVDNLNRTHHQEKSLARGIFYSRLADFQRQLQVVKGQDTETLENLCSSQIRNGEYESALQSLKKVDGPNLPSIITRSYSSDEAQVPRIIQFVKLLQECPLQEQAYQGLFDVMEANDHLESPYMLLFLHEAFTPSCQTTGLLKLRTQVRAGIDKLISNFEFAVDFSPYNRILGYANVSESCGRSVRPFIPLMIRKGYKNPVDSGHILSFISQLPSHSHAVGYNAFLETLKSNRELDSAQGVHLARMVRKALDKSNYVSGDLQLFRKMKGEFSPEIRNLVWNGTCTIRNYAQEHLFVSYRQTGKVKNVSRKVFIHVPRGWTDKDPKNKWDFKPVEGSTGFHLRNVHYRDCYLGQSFKYLGCTSDTRPFWRGDGGTYSDRCDYGGYLKCYKMTKGWVEYEWKLEPITVGGNLRFRMKSSKEDSWRMGGDYLFSSYHHNDLDKYYVLTWKSARSYTDEMGNWDCS